jgi:hypothetical protein
MTNGKDDMEIAPSEGEVIAMPLEINRLHQSYIKSDGSFQESYFCVEGMTWEIYLTEKRMIFRSPFITGYFNDALKMKPGKATIGDIPYGDIEIVTFEKSNNQDGYIFEVMSKHLLYASVNTALIIGEMNARELLHFVVDKRTQSIPGEWDEALIDAMRFTVSNYEAVAFNGAADGRDRQLRFCPFPIIEILPYDDAGDYIVDTELTDMKAYKDAGVTIVMS